MNIHTRTKCRISESKLKPLWDLGELYLSDFYKTKDENKNIAPLRLAIGEQSKLLQLMDSVDRDLLYKQYWYLSGTNTTMTKQLLEVVETIPNWVRLQESDIVLDIGCNDGTLLGHYKDFEKLNRIGIDPATNFQKPSKDKMENFINGYFEKDLFLNFTKGKKAKAITSIAMYYDLEDPNKFANDIKNCLDENGVWILQLSYTPLMLIQNAFDNIIHEHLEYYTLNSLNYIMKKNDLKILDVDFNNTNAGSIRVTITHNSNDIKNVALYNKDIGEIRFKSTMDYENKYFENPEQSLLNLKDRVNVLKNQTLELLHKLKKQGKTVIGYGASTKGNTLLQYYGIDSSLIEFIAERQKQKDGTITPGSWIKIISEEAMRKMKPDYLFILPWHFSTEFYYREKELLKNGTKFIIPLPELSILE